MPMSIHWMIEQFLYLPLTQTIDLIRMISKQYHVLIDRLHLSSLLGANFIPRHLK